MSALRSLHIAKKRVNGRRRGALPAGKQDRMGNERGKEREGKDTQKEKETRGTRLATRSDRPADLWRQYLPPERQERATSLASYVKRYSTVLLNARQKAAMCVPLDQKIRAEYEMHGERARQTQTETLDSPRLRATEIARGILF